jgi:hypothetical protein
MKKIVLGLVAAGLLAIPSADAQAIPNLSDFLASCFRDASPCKLKLKDYVSAAQAQKIICLPKDVSVTEGSSELLRWLKSDAAQPLKASPFDDALYEGAIKLYPCATEPVAPPPPPAAPQQ